MAESSISWTDRVWNPTIGCSRQSAGCEHCYAEQFAYRLAAMGKPEYAGLTRKHGDGSVNWTGEVRLMPERLDLPSRWKKPAKIFVDSMSDLFHPAVPDDYIREVFAQMVKARWHTYQILTKRPERMRDLLNQDWWVSMGLDWTRHIWLGTSAGSQLEANTNVPPLLQTFGLIHFVSAEPLIEPVDFGHVWIRCSLCGAENRATTRDCVGCGRWLPHYVLNWLIVGAESGEGRRPYDLDWARSLRDWSQRTGVAFFYKQGSDRYPGKDRELDGRMWEEFPGPDYRGGGGAVATPIS